jgi:hypothetical protein
LSKLGTEPMFALSLYIVSKLLLLTLICGSAMNLSA